MGVSVQQWRAVIGCFSLPGPREKFKPATITLGLYTFRSTYRLVFVCALLFICGDVELNPGPPKNASTRTTRQARLTTTGDLDIDVDPDIHASLRSEIVDLKKSVADCKTAINNLQAENNDLRSKVDSLENQSRRDNLVFHGLPEATGDDYETWDSCEEKVREIIHQKFDFQNVDDKDLPIERAHRVGNKQPGKCRPVVVRFSRWKDKQSVLESARSKARDSRGQATASAASQQHRSEHDNVRVSEDFSATVRESRRNLVAHMQTLRQERPNLRMSLRFDRLWVDGKTYTYNADIKSVQELPRFR